MMLVYIVYWCQADYKKVKTGKISDFNKMTGLYQPMLDQDGRPEDECYRSLLDKFSEMHYRKYSQRKKDTILRRDTEIESS